MNEGFKCHYVYLMGFLLLNPNLQLVFSHHVRFLRNSNFVQTLLKGSFKWKIHFLNTGLQRETTRIYLISINEHVLNWKRYAFCQNWICRMLFLIIVIYLMYNRNNCLHYHKTLTKKDFSLLILINLNS